MGSLRAMLWEGAPSAWRGAGAGVTLPASQGSVVRYLALRGGASVLPGPLCLRSALKWIQLGPGQRPRCGRGLRIRPTRGAAEIPRQGCRGLRGHVHRPLCRRALGHSPGLGAAPLGQGGWSGPALTEGLPLCPQGAEVGLMVGAPRYSRPSPGSWVWPSGYLGPRACHSRAWQRDRETLGCSPI